MAKILFHFLCLFVGSCFNLSFFLFFLRGNFFVKALTAKYRASKWLTKWLTLMVVTLYADDATSGTPTWIGKGLTCVCFKRKGSYERICINLTPLQASTLIIKEHCRRTWKQDGLEIILPKRNHFSISPQDYYNVLWLHMPWCVRRPNGAELNFAQNSPVLITQLELGIDNGISVSPYGIDI